jgi:hypothetical protein
MLCYRVGGLGEERVAYADVVGEVVERGGRVRCRRGESADGTAWMSVAPLRNLEAENSTVLAVPDVLVGFW